MIGGCAVRVAALALGEASMVELQFHPYVGAGMTVAALVTVVIGWRVFYVAARTVDCIDVVELSEIKAHHVVTTGAVLAILASVWIIVAGGAFPGRSRIGRVGMAGLTLEVLVCAI